MGAGHSHGHDTGGSGNRRRLTIVLVLIVGYMVAEIVGGILTNSLALLADAGHMFSDAGALALSVFAIWIAAKPPTSTHTYGYYRTEILAALANGATLVAVAFFVCWEAVGRLREPPEVAGGTMLAIAAGGLLVNLVALWILHGGRSDSLNVRGAWLHVLADALGSVGTIAAGALILFFGWNWADSVASIVISLLILYSSWSLLREAVAVLMEGTPGHIDVDEVRERIATLSGVCSVHDLHVWTITSGMVSLSAHVAVDEGHYGEEMLRAVRTELHDRFGIDHSTIQLEYAGFHAHAGEVCGEMGMEERGSGKARV